MSNAINTPKPEPLIFPRGVRFPFREECPPDIWSEIAAKISSANVTTGYISYGPGEFYDELFEANVHAPQLFALFRDLVTSLLPEVAAPIIGLKDEQALFGPYTDRDLALQAFEPYADTLQNDGFLEFGMMFSHEGRIDEIFIPASKYVKIWTNQPEKAEDVLLRHGIPRLESMEFIDQYPITSLSVDPETGNAVWQGVLESIQEEFRKLPPK